MNFMLSAITLEDEVFAQERLKLILQENNIVILNTFNNAQQTINWLAYNQVEIIFVDIGLPKIHDIEFVKNFKLMDIKNTSIIFSKSYAQYAIETFSLNATDDLLKPFHSNRLKKALNKPNNDAQSNEQNFHFFIIQLKLKNECKKIPWQKVTYLHAEDKGVLLVSNHKKKYKISEKQQPQDQSIKIHINTLISKHMLKLLIKIETKAKSKVARSNHTLKYFSVNQ